MLDRLLEVLGRLLEERVSLCDDGDGVDGGDTYPVEFSFEFYPHGNIQACFMTQEGYQDWIRLWLLFACQRACIRFRRLEVEGVDHGITGIIFFNMHASC